jgi:uncharacterized protein
VRRAVLDANVYVSAAVHPAGVPGQLLDKLARGGVEAVLSPAIVDEVRRVLGYPKVRKAIRIEIPLEHWLQAIVMLADVVDDRRVLAVCPDPDDDKYLAAALEGRAAFVVTGDQAFLALEEHEGVRIVTPRVFLDLL